MTDKQIIDLTEIDKKYKDKCSLIKAGKCKNVNIFIEQSRKLKAKEQECEELKEINQELLKYRKHSTTCQECYKDGLEDGKLDNKELRKLRKTLAEIKEIAEKTLNMVDYKTYFKRDNKSLKQEGFKAIDQILQKISECEGDNEI